MIWVLVNGALTIPGTGIEIRQAGDTVNGAMQIPYTLHSPGYGALAYWSLENAKSDGEKFAKELAEFRG
jgi:hypothetical protein